MSTLNNVIIVNRIDNITYIKWLSERIVKTFKDNGIHELKRIRIL